MILYHVSPKVNRSSIEERGLVRFVEGWDHGYVWAFDDLALAELNARTVTWGGHPAPHDVFQIDATGLDVVPDPHPGWGRPELDDHAFAIVADLEPARLLRLTL